MPVTGPIPLPNPSKWGDFSDILQNLMQQRMQQQQMMQTGQYQQGMLGQHAKELEETSGYHQKLLKQQANELAQKTKYQQAEQEINRQKIPLTLQYLKAQIENQKAHAKQREAAANTANGLSKTNISRNEAIIQSIDNVTPLINSLKESEFPGQTIEKYYHPNQQADYEAKTSAITDSLMAALGLPKTNESLELVKTMVTQHKFESREAYKTRLNGLIDDLSSRKKRAKSSIKEGVFGNDEKTSDEDTDYVINENGDLVPRSK